MMPQPGIIFQFGIYQKLFPRNFSIDQGIVKKSFIAGVKSEICMDSLSWWKATGDLEITLKDIK